jgi:ribosomal protein L34E
MPESHKAEKRRVQKANRAAGIGDEAGRIQRVKDAAPMAKCTVCQAELRITKSNTELNMHATGKHAKTVEECFPGADKIAEEMSKNGKKVDEKPTDAKEIKKKKPVGDFDALLDAGLSAGKKGKK